MSRDTVWSVLDESMSMSIKFKLELDGVVHDAKISYEALHDHFNAGKVAGDEEAAFLDNASQIRDVVVAKIVRGEADPIIVRSRDF
ncbi:hypothetical protein [Paraburkholderia terrae]|uniref:hypothetical protein n=1 Tax=Paraburkholderia terrae TaxID=311230 RepID=UPI001EE169B1|nr:hypothetical protein [Paraburkholderia terrae]GJH04992.1 hypothetical protein CBA19C8_30565 [Paraburkholderia terrae]